MRFYRPRSRYYRDVRFGDDGRDFITMYKKFSDAENEAITALVKLHGIAKDKARSDKRWQKIQQELIVMPKELGRVGRRIGEIVIGDVVNEGLAKYF